MLLCAQQKSNVHPLLFIFVCIWFNIFLQMLNLQKLLLEIQAFLKKFFWDCVQLNSKPNKTNYYTLLPGSEFWLAASIPLIPTGTIFIKSFPQTMSCVYKSDVILQIIDLPQDKGWTVIQQKSFNSSFKTNISVKFAFWKLKPYWNLFLSKRFFNKVVYYKLTSHWVWSF